MTPTPNDPPKRSRLVIPLGRFARAQRGVAEADVSGPRPRGRGCLKVLLALLLIATVLLGAAVVGAYLYWQHYRSQPGYSIALLVYAAQHDDTETFDTLVDMDQVVDGLADRVIERAGNTTGADVPDALRSQLLTTVKSMRPAIKERAREEAFAQIKQKSAQLEGQPFVLIALAVPFETEIHQDGDDASVKRDKTELKLKRDGSHWKVIAVDDDEVIERIMTNALKELPLPQIPRIPGIN